MILQMFEFLFNNLQEKANVYVSDESENESASASQFLLRVHDSAGIDNSHKKFKIHGMIIND